MTPAKETSPMVMPGKFLSFIEARSDKNEVGVSDGFKKDLTAFLKSLSVEELEDLKEFFAKQRLHQELL